VKTYLALLQSVSPPSNQHRTVYRRSSERAALTCACFNSRLCSARRWHVFV
jgi:hypothetical protein